MKRFFDNLYKRSHKEFIALLEDKLSKEERCFVITANPETFISGKNDPSFAEMLLDDETQMVADGIGIIMGAKKLGINIPERIPGVEIAEEILNIANEKELSVYLFGATEEVIDTVCAKLKTELPGLRIAGAQNGYAEDKDAVFEEIKTLSPDIVLVALGVPAQEKLIWRHIKDFHKGVFIGVGGSFDVLSGVKARAPEFFIKCNLEWLYRIAKEPKRIKRFYNNNIKFLFSLKK